MQKDTIAIIGVIITAAGVILGQAVALQTQIMRLDERIYEHTAEATKLRIEMVEHIESSAELAEVVDSVTTAVKELRDRPPAKSSSAAPASAPASSSGNDVTETLDYVGAIPKRIGKEAERAVEKIKDLF